MPENTTPAPPSHGPSDTLRAIWSTLPPRIPSSQGGNAMLGGVCEGIGARYGIDPVLVRLAFVALTFAFGGGIFLYLLFFLVMPRFGTPVSPWRAVNTPKQQLDKVGRSERDTGWALLVGLFIFFPTLSLGDGEWAAPSIFTIALAFAAMYLLHQRRPVPPEGLLARPAGGSTLWRPAGSVDTSHLTVPEGYTHPAAGRPSPPSWDPLGTAPELWHLPDLPPEQPAPQAAPRNRGQAIFWVIAGLLSIGLATSALVAALGVVAYRSDSIRPVTYTVTDDLQDRYETAVGSTRLDLSALAPLDKARTADLEHGLGSVEIVPPRDVRVELTCEVGIGSQHCPPVLNPDAPGEPLRLNVDLGLGTIHTLD